MEEDTDRTVEATGGPALDGEAAARRELIRNWWQTRQAKEREETSLYQCDATDR